MTGCAAAKALGLRQITGFRACRSVKRSPGALRAIIAGIGATAVIPSNRTRRIIIPRNANAYKQRNRIEHCFCKLKQIRRFATRYDRRTANCTASSISQPQ